jgi:hypothetical protein
VEREREPERGGLQKQSHYSRMWLNRYPTTHAAKAVQAIAFQGFLRTYRSVAFDTLRVVFVTLSRASCHVSTIWDFTGSVKFLTFMFKHTAHIRILNWKFFWIFPECNAGDTQMKQ